MSHVSTVPTVLLWGLICFCLVLALAVFALFLAHLELRKQQRRLWARSKGVVRYVSKAVAEVRQGRVQTAEQAAVTGRQRRVSPPPPVPGPSTTGRHSRIG